MSETYTISNRQINRLIDAIIAMEEAITKIAPWLSSGMMAEAEPDWAAIRNHTLFLCEATNALTVIGEIKASTPTPAPDEQPHTLAVLAAVRALGWNAVLTILANHALEQGNANLADDMAIAAAGVVGCGEALKQ